MTPFVVVEGPDGAFELATRALAGAGWVTVRGFEPPFRVPGVARTGRVDGSAAAGAALLAALDGQALVIHATADRDVIDRLIDDLRRLGPVEHRVGGTDVAADIGEDARAILALLAAGYTLGEAADRLGLSRRTADRRLAEARRVLGVERTTEAVVIARREGWLATDQSPGI